MSTEHLLLAERSEIPRPCLFLDRDGILFHDTGYIGRYDAVTWIPGAKEVIGRFNRAGWFVVIVTNQSGVARGYFTLDDVQTLHRAMLNELQADGLRIDAIYTSPYHPRGTIQKYCADHHNRKPNPGMLELAIRDLNIDTSRSLLLGDKPSDVEAAHGANVRGCLFSGNNLAQFVEASALWP